MLVEYLNKALPTVCPGSRHWKGGGAGESKAKKIDFGKFNVKMQFVVPKIAGVG